MTSSGAHGSDALFQPHRGAVRGAVYGLAAAMLFGISAPVSKMLLSDLPPLLLAALLYLGAGVALLVVTPFAPREKRNEAPLRRSDLPLLAGIVLTGGILGPYLMLVGLQRVSGLAGSLLLNLEAPFTMIVALLFFGEHLARREALAGALIVGGGLTLAWMPGEFNAHWVGALSIAGACLSWALDNNWTQRLALKDPFAVVRIKTLGAGICSLVLALALGQWITSIRATAAALVVGVFSYGISILLDAYALRHVGAAREAAFFATAPFIGAVVAIPLLHERPTSLEVTGMLAMAAGVAALLRVRHTHFHTHEAMEHEHVHVHDDHHDHPHEADAGVGERHSHIHTHAPFIHDHPHVSDAHHRHHH